MLRVMIVDDQKLMCEGLKTILQSSDQYQVTATAGSGEQALAELALQPADLVLLDIRMPDLDGVQTVGIIKQRFPQVKVVMLTTFNDEDYIMNAIANGADGYLLKDMETDELFRAIGNAMQGNLVMPPQVAGKLRSGLLTARSRRDLGKKLTELGFSARELEIARLLAEGFTNSQIAAALFLTPGTTRNYISVIYEKLGVRDRANALIILSSFS